MKIPKKTMSTLALSIAIASQFSYADSVVFDGSSGSETLLKQGGKYTFEDYSNRKGLFFDNDSSSNNITLNLNASSQIYPEFILGSVIKSDNSKIDGNSVNITSDGRLSSTNVISTYNTSMNSEISNSLLSVSGGGTFDYIGNVVDSNLFNLDVNLVTGTKAFNNTTTIKDGEYVLSTEISGVRSSLDSYNNTMSLDNVTITANPETTALQPDYRQVIVGSYAWNNSDKNIFTINDSTLLKVVGSRGRFNDSNQLDIVNTKIFDELQGIRLVEGVSSAATNNTLFIKDSEVSGLTFGVYTNRDTTNASLLSNTLNSENNIFNKSVFSARARGAYSNVENNILIDNGSTFLEDVISGYSDYTNSTSSYNELYLKNSIVEGSALAGSSQNLVYQNIAVIEDSVINGDTIGSISYNGIADGNKTSLKNTVINAYAYGGSGRKGAFNNTLTVEGGSFGDSSYGLVGGSSALGDVVNNTLSIKNLKTEARPTLYGGWSGTSSTGYVANNTAIIEGGDAMRGTLIGGYSNNASNAVIENNKVIVQNNANVTNIKGGSGKDNSIIRNNTVIVKASSRGTNIYGGDGSNATSVDNNKVYLLDGSRVNSEIVGGRNTIGSANNNTVVVGASPTINGNIYGGATTEAGSANYNTVSIQEGTFKDIYGGKSDTGDAYTGNRLNVNNSSDKSITAGNISNFQDIYFDVSKANSTNALLNVNTVNLGREVDGAIENGRLNITGSLGTGITSAKILHVTSTNTDDIIRNYDLYVGGHKVINDDVSNIDFINSFTSDLSADKKTLSAGLSLSWFANPIASTGDFTILNDSSFTVSGILNDQAPNPTLSWDGKSLHKKGTGTLILAMDNTYTGGTTISEGTLQIGNNGTSGSIVGDIVNNGTLSFNRSDDFTVDGVISGVGGFVKNGDGKLVLTSDNTYTGGTIINSGNLVVNSSNALGSGDITNNSDLTLSNVNGNFINRVYGSGNVELIDSKILASSNLQNKNLTINKDSQLILDKNVKWSLENIVNSGEILLSNNTILEGDLTNNSQLTFVSSDTNSSITSSIKGNYSANNAVLNMKNMDNLLISGNVSGKTVVNVIPGSNSGQKNVPLISATSTDSPDAFVLGAPVAGGVYDYTKLEYSNYRTTSQWSLIGEYSPIVGSYVANQQVGNNLFTSRLEDREGDYLNYNGPKRDFWIRGYGTHNKFSTLDSLKTDGNSFATQVGTNLITLGTNSELNIGILGGYGHYNSTTNSTITGNKAKSKVDGYSLGIFSTWYASPLEKQGAYLDSWLLWNDFTNTVEVNSSKYKYDSSGITASIEVGGNYSLLANDKIQWWVQPQAQLIYQNVGADSFTDNQGASISNNSENLQSRLGFKTYLNIPTNNSISYSPYMALNLIHNTNTDINIDGVSYSANGSETLGEFKIGLEGTINTNNKLWINASFVGGSHDNQAYQGNIGWKYSF